MCIDYPAIVFSAPRTDRNQRLRRVDSSSAHLPQLQTRSSVLFRVLQRAIVATSEVPRVYFAPGQTLGFSGLAVGLQLKPLFEKRLKHGAGRPQVRRLSALREGLLSPYLPGMALMEAVNYIYLQFCLSQFGF